MGLTASIKVMKIVDSVPSCSVELWLGQMMSSTIGWRMSPEDYLEFRWSCCERVFWRGIELWGWMRELRLIVLVVILIFVLKLKDLPCAATILLYLTCDCLKGMRDKALYWKSAYWKFLTTMWFLMRPHFSVWFLSSPVNYCFHHILPALSTLPVLHSMFSAAALWRPPPCGMDSTTDSQIYIKVELTDTWVLVLICSTCAESHVIQISTVRNKTLLFLKKCLSRLVFRTCSWGTYHKLVVVVAVHTVHCKWIICNIHEYI